MVAVKKQTVSGGSNPLEEATEPPIMVSLSKLWLNGRSSLMSELGIMHGRPNVMLKVLPVTKSKMLACKWQELTYRGPYIHTRFVYAPRLRSDSARRRLFSSVDRVESLHVQPVRAGSKLGRTAGYPADIGP
jgi:hypothetical protein